jgi:uncharacterized membrane protein
MKSFKIFAKVAIWLAIYVAAIGFILPELFSAKSNTEVTLGIIIVLGLLFRTIMFIPWSKINNFLKENM